MSSLFSRSLTPVNRSTGSLAALWQSVWYGAAVPARSLFACLQAAGMAGNTIIGWPLTILLTVFLIVAGLLYLAPHPDWPFDPLHRWLPGPWLNGTATA